MQLKIKNCIMGVHTSVCAEHKLQIKRRGAISPVVVNPLPPPPPPPPPPHSETIVKEGLGT